MNKLAPLAAMVFENLETPDIWGRRWRAGSAGSRGTLDSAVFGFFGLRSSKPPKVMRTLNDETTKLP
jgi:hypothetical protein